MATKIGAERVVFERSSRAMQRDSAEFNPFLKHVVDSHTGEIPGTSEFDSLGWIANSKKLIL